MSHFKPAITNAPEGTEDGDIVKVQNGEGVYNITEFNFPKLSRGPQTYQEVKKSYGPLSATDPDRKAPTRKDERFALNPMSKQRLSIEEEERRVIQERVEKAVADATVTAVAAAERAGYEDGLNRGRDEAYAEYSQKCEPRLVRIAMMVEEFEKAKVEIFKANEKLLVDMIFRIARMLLLKELEQDRDYVTRLARALIDRYGVRDNIRIKLNDRDLAEMGKLRKNLEESFGTLNNLRIEPTDQVESGGLLLETDLNAIDAGVDQQLEGIRNALKGGAQ